MNDLLNDSAEHPPSDRNDSRLATGQHLRDAPSARLMVPDGRSHAADAGVLAIAQGA